MERFDNLLDTSNAIDTEARYRDFLRDCYSDNLTGIFANYDPAQVLEEIDPTAYRCGHNDYIDGEDWTEYNGETYETSYLEEIREQAESELSAELYDLETELADMPQLCSVDSVPSAELVARNTAVKAAISAIRAELYQLSRLF